MFVTQLDVEKKKYNNKCQVAFGRQSYTAKYYGNKTEVVIYLFI